MSATDRAARARLAAGAGALLACAALLTGGAMHAKGQRARADESARGLSALGAHLPSPDVAITGGARWLRALSLEEPGAAQADGIAFPDPEPGSGAVSAPRAAWATEARR